MIRSEVRPFVFHAADYDAGNETRRQAPGAGVAFILDTKLQAARTALRNGRSVNSTAGPHRSLRARARSCTMCSPVAPFHLAPQRFIRTSNRLLQVASALPLPSGRPSRRARA